MDNFRRSPTLVSDTQNLLTSVNHTLLFPFKTGISFYFYINLLTPLHLVLPSYPERSGGRGRLCDYTCCWIRTFMETFSTPLVYFLVSWTHFVSLFFLV